MQFYQDRVGMKMVYSRRGRLIRIYPCLSYTLAVPPLGPTHNTPTRIPWGSPGGPTTHPSTRPHHKTVQDSPRENEHLIQRSLARVPAPAKTEGQIRGNRVAVAGTYEFRRPDPVFLIDRAKDEINLCESRGQCVPSAQRGRGLPSAR